MTSRSNTRPESSEKVGIARDRFSEPWVLYASLDYAAVILAFMGAIHWGLAMRDRSGAGAGPYLWGVTPSLLAWLALLLVRLHNVGFYWGDVSLSNTLFRRDAGAFAAYLVDAETGELHEEGLTDGQRAYDLDLARTNIAGEQK